jgi:hypothetical protein
MSSYVREKKFGLSQLICVTNSYVRKFHQEVEGILKPLSRELCTKITHSKYTLCRQQWYRVDYSQCHIQCNYLCANFFGMDAPMVASPLVQELLLSFHLQKPCSHGCGSCSPAIAFCPVVVGGDFLGYFPRRGDASSFPLLLPTPGLCHRQPPSRQHPPPSIVDDDNDNDRS